MGRELRELFSENSNKSPPGGAGFEDLTGA